MLRNILLEFKKFALRGSVFDMAVGIVIGSSFGKIVDSLVKDIIMPPIGIILGKVDLTNLFFILKTHSSQAHYPSLSAAQAAGAVTINFGAFLNTIVSFLIVSICVFTALKVMSSVHLRAEGLAVECPYCRSTISKNATRCPHCTSNLTDRGN
jgi:large conductance mechanosensitive channel